MKNLISRSILIATALFLGITFSVGSAAAQGCSGGANLSGWYGMLVGTNGGSGGKYLVGAVHFDGACGITGTNTFGGVGGNFAQASVTGTYGLNSDGTIGITLNLSGQSTPQTYIVGVSQSGNEAVGIETDGTSAFIDLQSQLTTLTSGFNAASLNGTYAIACIGAGTDLNYQTFDGLGNITGVDSEYNSGSVTTNTPYTGTYTVNSDGTYQGSVLFNGSQVSFYGVLDNGNNEVEFIYTGVNSCSGKKGTTTNLSGTYGIVVSGPATTGGGEQFLTGAVNFSGGLLSGEVNGGLNSQYGNSAVNGSYLVNSNNTVTITMNLAGQSTPQTYNVGVSETGNEADGIETDGTAEAVIDLQSQLLTTGQTYTTSSLNGTYAVACSNTGIVALNYVTFDGLGNLSGSLVYSNGGSYGGDNPIVGTYAVNADGTFSGSLGGGFPQYSFTGVIDNDTSEIAYTYEVGGSGNQACSGVSTYGPVGSAPVAATPTFNPAPGNISSGQSVSLSDTLSTAVIHYTTNGTPPTANSAVYNAPIPVNGVTSIQALAVAPGFNNSAIGSGTYYITSLPTALTPTFNPLPGNYPSSQVVNLLDATPGAVVHCTTDGSTPSATSPVCTSVTVSVATTIEAIAVAPGYNNSPIATGVYTIGTPGFTLSMSAPSLTLGENTGGTINVTVNPVNGFTGTVNFSATGFPAGVGNTFQPTSSTTGSTLSISVPSNAVVGTYPITVTGISGGLTVNTSFTFNVTSTLTALNPGFSPLPGTYSTAQTVILSDTTPGAVIHCTTNGTTPTASSPVCTSVSVTGTTTIEALAVAPGYNNSAVVVGVYTLTAATPTFSPLPGNYSSAQTVILSDTTPGAVIHCTTNGTTPTATSPVCTTVSVSSTTTIEALAVATGYNNSAVATGVYTINSGAGTVVSLSSYFNVYGIGTAGTAPKNGGFDNDSYAYNSSLLGSSLTYQGLVFTLGAANAPDAVDAQTISITPGQYSQLYLLGAGVNGSQLNQTIVVTYTDNSTSTFTQSFSDWTIPKGYTGETTVVQTANRITPSGGTQNGTIDVYGYTFPLTSGKSIASVKLPPSRNVVFLGMGLASAAGTPIVPYLQVNSGAWQQTAVATVTAGSSVNLGPQPLTGGSWSWSGPNGYTSTARQINNIPLSVGNNVYTATYTNTVGAKSTQAFTITVQGNLIANGTYYITSVNSGLAIDDPGFSKQLGKDMQQYTLNRGTNQQWTVNNLGNNVITLTNVSSGLLLEVAGASKSNTALIDQWSNLGTTSQEWTVVALSGGAYELVNVNSGLALDVPGGSKNVGVLLDQYQYQGNAWQQWQFTSNTTAFVPAGPLAAKCNTNAKLKMPAFCSAN